MGSRMRADDGEIKAVSLKQQFSALCFLKLKYKTKLSSSQLDQTMQYQFSPPSEVY